MAKADPMSGMPLTFPQATEEELRAEAKVLIEKIKAEAAVTGYFRKDHRLGLIQDALKQRARIKDQQQIELLRKAKEDRGLT